MNAQHPAIPESKEILTIDPDAYVAAVYAPFDVRLQSAIAETAGVTYDITTKEGMQKAKDARSLFSGIRIECEKARQQRKAPILEIGKLLDSRAKEITALIAPHEDRFDADIKAEQRRIEDEKAAKIKAEAELQARIDAIKNLPLRALDMTATRIAEEIEEWQQVIPDAATYGERFVEAEIAIKTTVAKLQEMLSAKRAQEELVARVAAERREAEERTRAEAEERARADEEARKKQAEEAARLAAERVELERQRAEFVRERQEADAKAAAEARAKALAEEEARARAEAAARAEAESKAKAEADAKARAEAAARAANRPSDKEIIDCVAEHFGVSFGDACDWIMGVAESMKAAA